MNSTMVSKQAQILGSPDPPYAALPIQCPSSSFHWEVVGVSSWMAWGEGHTELQSPSLAPQPGSRWSGTDGGGVPGWVGVLGENWAVYRQTLGFLGLRSEHLQLLTSFFMTASSPPWAPTPSSSLFPKQCLLPPSRFWLPASGKFLTNWLVESSCQLYHTWPFPREI